MEALFQKRQRETFGVSVRHKSMVTGTDGETYSRQESVALTTTILVCAKHYAVGTVEAGRMDDWRTGNYPTRNIYTRHGKWK